MLQIGSGFSFTGSRPRFLADLRLVPPSFMRFFNTLLGYHARGHTVFMNIDFEGLYGFHGHRCPMSTLGARLGIAAMKALGVTKSDQFSVRGVYRARNCALDGIQFVTGCTLGNGNIEFEDAGRASFSLVRRDGSGRVTASVSEDALARFMRHKEKKAALERERRDSGGRTPAGSEEELKKDFDDLVEWVQSAPDEGLLVITEG